jgi:mono/diheme cytochrome c family protein
MLIIELDVIRRLTLARFTAMLGDGSLGFETPLSGKVEGESVRFLTFVKTYGAFPCVILLLMFGKLAGITVPRQSARQIGWNCVMAYKVIKLAGFAFFVTFISEALPPLQVNAASAGKAEYDRKCASCHGREGAGDGVVASALRTKPPNLRQLARKNDGLFPERYLVNVIDGRHSLRAHGNYEMPVWGRDLSNGNSEASESTTVKEIVDYLKEIQD